MTATLTSAPWDDEDGPQESQARDGEGVPSLTALLTFSQHEVVWHSCCLLNVIEDLIDNVLDNISVTVDQIDTFEELRNAVKASRVLARDMLAFPIADR